jgi:hypothetical protein
MPNYVVKYDITTSKKDVMPDGTRQYRAFKRGEYIGAKPNGIINFKGQKVLSVLTTDNFILPINAIEKLSVQFSDDGKIQKSASKIQEHQNTDILTNILEKSKKASRAIMIGAFSGFVYALYKRQSIFIYGTIGGLIGGAIGYNLPKNKTKQNV